MGALVEWEDATRNIVSTNDIECVGDEKTFRKGQKVRMQWKRKYYYGTIKAIETESGVSEESDSDDIPLCSVFSGENRKLSNFVKTLETKDMKAVDWNSDSDDDVPLSHITRDKKRKLQKTDSGKNKSS